MLALGARGQETEIELEGQKYFARLQDVSGLVDLNYASPELLTALISGLGHTTPETEAGVINIRRFRETGARLLRVADFWRIGQLEEIATSNITNLTTVYSGKSGISPEDAPIELLEMLTGGTGPAGSLQNQLPDSFVSLASGGIFQLFIRGGDYSQEALFAGVRVDPNSNAVTILFLR